MNFPITEQQFNEWLARVAALEPGRVFTRNCSVSCIVAEAVHDVGEFALAAVVEGHWWPVAEKWGSEVPAPSWIRPIIEWFDAQQGLDSGGEGVVRAADLWPAYCAKFGIAPPPVEAAARSAPVAAGGER